MNFHLNFKWAKTEKLKEKKPNRDRQFVPHPPDFVGGKLPIFLTAGLCWLGLRGVVVWHMAPISASIVSSQRALSAVNQKTLHSNFFSSFFFFFQMDFECMKGKKTEKLVGKPRRVLSGRHCSHL